MRIVRLLVRTAIILCVSMIAGLTPCQRACAAIHLAILAADSGNFPTADLNNTGKFSSITVIDTRVATPTLGDLSGFDAILSYTNSTPDNASTLGNVLADYVDGGGHLALATYSFSSPWAVAGRIMTAGYSPLTNLVANGSITSSLTAIVPGDPIFNGVDLSTIAYFINGNFAHPGLDAGATLLATDSLGTNIIARNAAGNVIGLNLFPGSHFVNNGEFYELIANALVPTSDGVVPEPLSLFVWTALAGTSAVCVWMRRRGE